MICHSCGKMTADSSRKCVHCNAFQEKLGLQSNRNDRMAVLCPQCDVKTTIINLLDIELDYCSKCNGIWFDKGELKQLKNIVEQNRLTKDVRECLDEISFSDEKITFKTHMRCPVCKEQLKQKVFMDVTGIVLDRCDNHGVWVEKSDLSIILDMLEPGNINKLKKKKALFDKYQSETSCRNSRRKKLQHERDMDYYNYVLKHMWSL